MADSGFLAFAPDLYQGKIADNIADAENLVRALNTNPQKALHEIVEAVQFLNERFGKAGRGLAVIGFSLGASYAMDLAASHPDHVDSVVLFYGTGGGDFSNSRARFLGHFAENDEFEPQSSVNELMESLESIGRPVIFYNYPDVGHWFFESDRPDAYDPAAASLAWDRTLSSLKGQPTS